MTEQSDDNHLNKKDFFFFFFLLFFLWVGGGGGGGGMTGQITDVFQVKGKKNNLFFFRDHMKN